MPESIEQIVRPVIEQLGLDLESVAVVGQGKHRQLRITVDADGGVGIDLLADASRAVSTELDAADVMGNQPYTLEVSSRGIDESLTAQRHWRRNQGRLVKVVLLDGSKIEARVGETDDAGVNLLIRGDATYYAYEQIASAHVQVELTRKDI